MARVSSATSTDVRAGHRGIDHISLLPSDASALAYHLCGRQLATQSRLASDGKLVRLSSLPRPFALSSLHRGLCLALLLFLIFIYVLLFCFDSIADPLIRLYQFLYDIRMCINYLDTIVDLLHRPLLLSQCSFASYARCISLCCT